MGKPLSRPDCLRQNPSCLGKTDDEDTYIEDCYVPQRSIYDTMRINEQIDQGSKTSKSPIERAEGSTLSSNGTLGASNLFESKAPESKKLDERVIFDALKLSSDAPKSAPVPPKRKPNPDRKENINRRSWKLFMPPNFTEFAERLGVSLSEITETGVSNPLLQEKGEFGHLLAAQSTGQQHDGESPADSWVFKPDSKSFDIVEIQEVAKGVSEDHHNSEFGDECNPLLEYENIPHATAGFIQHRIPSNATWPGALKDVIKGSHHETAEASLEDCTVESVHLSPCLSEVLLDSSREILSPTLREKTESELKFEEDERRIMMESEREWEAEKRLSVLRTDERWNCLLGTSEESEEMIVKRGCPATVLETKHPGRLLPLHSREDLEHSELLERNASSVTQEVQFQPAINLGDLLPNSEQLYGFKHNEQDSDNDSDHLFLELEKQCLNENGEAVALAEMEVQTLNFDSKERDPLQSLPNCDLLESAADSEKWAGPAEVSGAKSAIVSNVNCAEQASPVISASGTVEHFEEEISSSPNALVDIISQQLLHLTTHPISPELKDKEMELTHKNLSSATRLLDSSGPVSCQLHTAKVCSDSNVSKIGVSDILLSPKNDIKTDCACVDPALSSDAEVKFTNPNGPDALQMEDCSKICEPLSKMNELSNVNISELVIESSNTNWQIKKYQVMKTYTNDANTVDEGVCAAAAFHCSHFFDLFLETSQEIMQSGGDLKVEDLSSPCHALLAEEIKQNRLNNRQMAADFLEAGDLDILFEIRTGIIREAVCEDEQIGPVVWEKESGEPPPEKGYDPTLLNPEKPFVVDFGAESLPAPAHVAFMDTATERLLHTGDSFVEELPTAPPRSSMEDVNTLTLCAEAVSISENSPAASSYRERLSDTKELPHCTVITAHPVTMVPASEQPVTTLNTEEAPSTAGASSQRKKKPSAMDKTQEASSGNMPSLPAHNTTLLPFTVPSVDLPHVGEPDADLAQFVVSLAAPNVGWLPGPDWLSILPPVLVFAADCFPLKTPSAEQPLISTHGLVPDIELFQKERVDPLQQKLQYVNGLGQGLIQSAEKNCDVHGLEHEIEELNTRWNTLNKKVAERVTLLQEALLHCGKFQDALEPLLSWLTDTEELIVNQKPPSAEYKVVKAQMQEQKLLQRLLEDRKPTVQIIQTEGMRIAESAEPLDKEKILGQLENLEKRWEGLLGKAAARQKQLEDILVLAKEFHETAEPISDWLTATEKKLANSEPVGTQTVKIQQQIVRHKALEEEILSHAADVEQMVRTGQNLTSLSSMVDRSMLAEKLDSVQAWYSEIKDRCCRKAVLLEQALSNAHLFGEDEMELLNWLAELEDKLRFVSVKDYKQEVLQKELADQLALNEEIVNRKKNVDQTIRNGQALLKQTTGDEVLLIQEKLDGIKTRYSEITSISLKALRMLEQAQQLATKFQSTHEELLIWLRKVEEELISNGGKSPIGEQMPKFQQRQKDLKKEVMEYRLVLDTVNEMSSALLALVPWRAREGLDKLVLDANSRYQSVRDTIEHRVHQIDAAIQRSQQYEQTTEAELAWAAETKRKLLALGPIRLEQDKTTSQLQVQKAFSLDIIRHKDSMDELLNIQEEILGTCGEEQKVILQDKVTSLVQQYNAVSQLNSERYAQLERAQVLVNQFWETHEELRPWIEETQVAIAQLPPPAVDHELLKEQQDEMRQLRESIAEHKPHIDKLMKIGPQLQALNPEEGEMVQEKYETAASKYSKIKADVHQRAMVLDEAITQAAQNIEFHDKMEPMLEILETLASRLHMPLLIPAEVDKIKESIGENKNALMELEKMLPSFEALKRRGEELIGRSYGADKDPAAKAIRDKLDQMVSFWEDIKAQANEREIKLLDARELAERFWCDLAALLTTIRDTQDIVHDLERPGIDPSIIKQQIEAAETIKEEADGLHEELEFIRILGTDLIFACGETEKPEVKKSLDEMNNAWENLNKTWKERLESLEEAMLTAVQYQDTLQAMFDWLDNTVIKLCAMPAVGTDLNTVKEQINEMKEFKMEVYQQQIEMEKLCHQGELMLKKAIDETDRDLIQEPLTELKHLWENLSEKILHRQHRLEAALLALGQFQHALAEVLTWLTHTEELLDVQKPISGDPKIIEVELAKHHVLKNDVLAHQTTFETVSRAGSELLESSAAGDANSLRNKLRSLNQCWESVCQKTEDREQQLEKALQQAQGFHGEIEDFLQWLNKVESQVSVSKATGGLPETAREQLHSHMEMYTEFKANEEIYKQLLDKGRLMLLSRTESTSSSNAEKNMALLEQKWHLVSAKMEEGKLKLEEALNLAVEFQNSLQEFINWLTQAEQSLNVVPPPSLILDMVLFQIDEHKVFVNEVNSHRDQIIELDKMGNQLKFLSQKQDVILIKNLLVSVQSRWEKVVQRSVERGRALDDSRKRAKQFHEAWKKLSDWLEDAENHLDSELEISNDPDKIKRQLSKHKEFQKTLGSRQPVYDTTVRTGRALKEKALLADDSQKLDNLLGEVRDKWDTVCGKSVERQHKLEEALLFSGQFMDALQALVDWLYRVEPQLAEEQPVHGDLDLVMNLMDIHKVFQKELGKRTSSVQALKRSARELIENSREDTTWVKVQLQELSTRWDTICKLSVSKQTHLEQALKKAEDFRSAVHTLLEWLSEAEQTLRFRGALPEDTAALQSLIDSHKDFMKNVEEKRVDVNTAVEMGESILVISHPDSVTSIKHWNTIIRARFEEVLTWGKQHQQRLEATLTDLLTNSQLLEELLAWIQWAETTLLKQDQEAIPQNIDQVKVLICEHQSFMEEMTRKQPDVDKITKTHKRKTTDPNHAPFMEKSRTSRKSVNQIPLPPLSHLYQAETKNPRINQLSARWQQVWLLALERQRKLNDTLDRLEELKEFANFDFDVWRKKYMRWMNHKKSRVMDFFRRIDKDQDGKITRQEFIDGILASKFPTTRLEMSAVADIFDRDGDGYIDYYEFVAVLHPNKDAYRPTTDADKIEDEVTRQVAQCKCAKRFQVEQIGENKYRFFLGNQFGDSQQLRLVRILRSTVMVRVGGGWMALDEFLVKNDPCRARGRTNLELREKFILPEGVSQGMAPFRSRGRRSKPSSRTASPTRSSSSASQSNHSCASLPSSPATTTSGTKTPQHPSRCYDKPWLVNSKAGTPVRGLDYSDLQMASSEVKRPYSSRTPLAGDAVSSSSQVSSGAKSSRADPKKNTSRPTSRAGSHAGSRASSRRGSDASDFDLLETQSACSDTSESSATGCQARSPRGSSKPSKIPTMSKKCTTPTPTKTPTTKR